MDSFAISFVLIIFFAVPISGSIEEAWFETIAVEESDCDDDFHSVQEGNPSITLILKLS